MSKKLILFLMVLLFGSTSFLRADEVTIGDPTATTTNSYLPTYSLYNYSLTQQIYTADEIGMSGTINDVTLWLKNSSSYARNLNVYMKEVSEATFADGTAWVSMTASDLVATGTLANGITEPVATTFTLSTPFNYTGMGNLVICFQDVTGSWSSGAASVVMVGNGNQAIYAYRDPSLYDPTTPGVSGSLTTNKSVVRLTIEGSLPPVPPTPGEGIAILPEEFELGFRPNNAWSEPFNAKIYNAGEPVVIEASMSNTAGNNPFTLNAPIQDITLGTEEAYDFSVNWTATAGEYTEEFTLFYAETRDVKTAPVTATVYAAAKPDVVEFPETITWASEAYSNIPDENNIHPNYNIWGMNGMLPDVVYAFTLENDSYFTADGGEYIAIYNNVDDLHITAAVEPVLYGEGGINSKLLLAGDYYMVVAGNSIGEVTASYEELPEPEEIAFIAPTPADGATSVNAPVTIKWAPVEGTSATEYQVVFGTSPIVNPNPNNWIPVDENYGTYTVTELLPTTQYFFKVYARNSKATVSTERRGFTSTLSAPYNVTSSLEEMWVDQTTLIKWKLAGQGGFEGEVTVCDGTETSSYIPVYGLWMDDYTRGEMIYPAEMLEEMDGGDITSMTFYISSAASGPWSGDVFNVYLMEVDATTMSSYYTSADATIVYTGALDGQGSTMTINFDTPYSYEGGNLLVGIEETVCGTYKSCSFYGVSATGASASGYSSASLAGVTFNQRDFLPKTTFVCGGAKSNRNFYGYNVYYGQMNDNNEYVYVKANSTLLTEREYYLSNLPYNMSEEGIDINVTAVYDEGESVHSTPIVKINVSSYGTLSGTVTELISGEPVANVNIKFMGRDEFNNNVTFTGTTDANGQYIINDVKLGNYIGEATLEGMEPNYSEQVILAYDDNDKVVNFQIHEEYKPVLSVYAEEIDSSMSRVRWSMTEIINGGGSGGGSATTFEEGFEGGMPEGWTIVDANNDGTTWTMTSAIPTTWTYYASLTLDWYRTGTNAICSGSYVNGIGALNPDEYLVTPQVNLVNGSTFTFWAAATDASYPADHFGVFVSDDMATWTSVQEWTLTAKEGGMNGGRASRDGNGAKLGSWYQYSVDLSAYAGQKYIAIRHFNCYDQYIMCVDDIALSTGRNRDVQSFNVFRRDVLLAGGIINPGVPGEPELLDNTTFTSFADFAWENMADGLYQYGVQAVYPIPSRGNRSITTVVYDFEDGVIPSEFSTTGTYPWTIAAANSGNVIKSSNGGVSSSSSEIVMTYDFPSEGTIAFDADCMGEGTGTFWDKCIFKIDGEEVFTAGANLPGWHNYSFPVTEGSHTFSWSYTKDSSVNPTGDYFAVDNIALTYETPGGDTNDDPYTEITWSNYLPKNMDGMLIVDADANVGAGAVAGAVVTLTNNFENIEFRAELDETGVATFDEFRKGEYTLTAILDGYDAYVNNEYIDPENGINVSLWNDTTLLKVNFVETLQPVAALTVSGTGFAMWTNMLPEPERVAERYHVLLNGVFQGETTDNFMQLDVTGLTVGQTYTASVAVIYTTGMSAFVTAEFTLIDCATVEQQVEDLEATPACMDVILTWNGATPGPGPGPTPPPTPGDDSFTEGFEGGLNGWNVLTVLSDGGEWIHSSQNLGGYDYSTLAHTGTGFAMCYSFVDYVGSFNTDSYMYTPQMYTIQAGSTLTFFADNANDSYPENFAVCVSTAANPSSASDFTTVWSGGAKGNGGDGAMVRRADNNRYENWRQHTVSLAAYAGQNVWIAFHDSNYDMYEIWIDDVVLSPNTKGGSTAETCGYTTAAAPVDAAWDLLGDFDCTSGYQYGVASDGQYIYTSSWSASSTSMFYKYDMDGNFIEEFNVSGCGQIRDLTYDGEYFYGVANSSVIYCIDLANHTLVGQTSTAYGAMRCCSYDSQRDGFWVVGNWSGNLSLVDRTGAVTFTGPAPESASGVAYYKDADNVEHVLCFNNADNGVYDYNVTTNVMGGQVFNYNNAPGAAGGSAGGCHVGTYAGKLAFFGDMQQSPNYVAIYELAGNPGPGPGPTPSSTITPNKFNIFMDGEFVGATAESTFTVTCEDTYLHNYEVYFVDSNYNFSCGGFVQVAAGVGTPVTDLTAVEGYDPTYGEGAQITWNGAANQYKIYANGQLLGATAETEVFIYGLQAGTYTFGVVAVYDECESEMVEVEFVYDAVAENEVINAIYPNPTSSDLHINATAMKHISVYNAMGQMVYDQDVTGDEVILNMGQYEAGVYMVNVVTENGSSVKRVTVVK